MLERSVLKNAVDCTSQRLKWTSGARVMLCLCSTLIGNCLFFLVFQRYELVRTLSVEKYADCTNRHVGRSSGALVVFFGVP